MRNCATCGMICNSQIGVARDLRTEFWGGNRHGSISYSPKVVAFFCTEEHRMQYLETGAAGGEIQTDRWEYNGDD